MTIITKSVPVPVPASTSTLESAPKPDWYKPLSFDISLSSSYDTIRYRRLQMHERGLTMRDMAEQEDVDISAIKVWYKNNGLTPNTIEIQSKPINAKVIGAMINATASDFRLLHEYLSGMSYQQIATKHNITNAGVRSRVRRAKLALIHDDWS